MKPLAGSDGGCRLVRSSPDRWLSICAAECGDSEGALAERPSLEDPGDKLSGLAIRRPPRDPARLRSPSIADLCIDNDSKQPDGGSI